MSTSNYTPIPLMPHSGVTLVAQPAVLKTERKSYKRTLYWLGFIEIILGVSAVLLGVIAMVIVSGGNGAMLVSSSGLWCGVFLVISGVLACRVKTRSNATFVNASMAISIVTSIFMAIMLIMAIIGLANWDGMAIMSGLYILLCVISIAGLMLTIVHAAFCCATVCCVRRLSQGQVLYSQVSSAQQLVQLPNGQYMIVQGQPLVPPPYEAAQLPGTSTLQPQFQQSNEGQPKPDQEIPPPPYSPQEQTVMAHPPS